MKLERTIILEAKSEYITRPASLVWQGNTLVDWVQGGNEYSLNGNIIDKHRGWGFPFDSAKATPDGTFTVLYQRHGTKGLLLKNGEIMRELNRSYYQSQAYEYPFEFFRLPDGRWAFAHCPVEYCRIDIEIAETGEIITNVPRKTQDVFYSRIRVSNTGKYMLHAGWVWHPMDIIEFYNLDQVLSDPRILDGYYPKLDYTEISSARFFPEEDFVLISTSSEDYEKEGENHIPPKHIGVYDISEGRLIKKTAVDFPFGNVIPIDMNYALDIFQHPKLIDLNSGKIINELPDIYTGEQCSSITWGLEKFPPIAISEDYRSIAVATEKAIELIEVKDQY